MKTAFVSEIFSTMQGEGPYTGERQVFLRLAGCPLRCDYCDQPESLVTTGHAQRSVDEVFKDVSTLCRWQSLNTVSVTGGEPLAHVGFCEELFPRLKTDGRKIYLETAGVHPEALAKVEPWVDVISMDMKFPSATGRDYWTEHKEFLKVGGKKVFVKIVIEAHSTPAELDEAVRLLAESVYPPLLVLQPVTPTGPAIKPPSPDQLDLFYQKARARLARVQVMAQQHKSWGMR